MCSGSQVYKPLSKLVVAVAWDAHAETAHGCVREALESRSGVVPLFLKPRP